MSDASLPIQQALRAAIVALGTEAEGRVFDDIPPDAGFPYISFGTAQTVPIDETCTDGDENYLDVNVWSREPGFVQAKRIAGAIHRALNEQPLTIEGQSCDRMQVRAITYSREPDGLTSRARIALQIDTQPLP